MTKKILVTGTSVRAELLQPLVDAGYRIDNPQGLLTEDELQQALSDSAGYLLGGDEYASQKALSKASNLKVIAFLGMGYESFVDAEAATELKIPVTNTPGTLSNSVAEFTVGLLLCCTRRIYLYANECAAGRTGTELKQRDLAALHVGIIGLGGIGSRIAHILRLGFGAKVSYFSRTRKPDLEKNLNIEYSTLDNLASSVDALILMTPGNDQTKNLFDKQRLSLLRQGTIVVNTARPEIVNSSALLEGLRTGRIGYAAFDGFYDSDEPQVVQELRGFVPSQLMITGHIGSLTVEARDGMARKATSSILNILQKGSDQHIVNGL